LTRAFWNALDHPVTQSAEGAMGPHAPSPCGAKVPKCHQHTLDQSIMKARESELACSPNPGESLHALGLLNWSLGCALNLSKRQSRQTRHQWLASRGRISLYTLNPQDISTPLESIQQVLSNGALVNARVKVWRLV
jgi:hypothetical protein